jgi:predicted metal-dependent HD superfamily phosphohydrolase
VTVTAPEIELRHVWRRVAGPHHDAIVDGLLQRHREPHRRYHTATHVMWVCRHVSELADAHPVDDLEALLAAALYHDAVYDPRSSTNEADSATLAVRDLTAAGWRTDRCTTVAQAILTTASHEAQTPDQDVLLDADLAILGGGANEYLAYSTAVRAEYAHVGESAWRDGRAQVLRHFLGQAAIFRTATMRQAREVRARANLAAELASLEHGQQ